MTLTPDPTNARVIDFIDRQHPEQIAFLKALVQVPSDNPPGDCQPHGEAARALLEGLGLVVETHPVPAVALQAVGMTSAVNLIVRRTFGRGGPTIALNAHGDVVPPGQGWTHDPYGGDIITPPEGAAMVGRGVAVSKSDFATYTWALLALIDAASRGVPLNGTVELHFTYDEETGGEVGPKWVLEQGLSRPDYAIAAGFAYGITSAHNGCLHLEVEVIGKQAHAAMPHTGIDALEGATHVLQALYAYRRQLAGQRSRVPGIDCATLNVGLIHGGINTNVVPDRVTMRIDRRMIPEEAGFDAEGELRRIIEDAVEAAPGIEVTITRVLLAEPLLELPAAAPLIAALKARATQVMNVAVPVHGAPLYTDARHYAAKGVPTVLYGAGPRTLMEARGHNTDENLRLEDLRKATCVVALTLADLMG
jgi:acetylornithine deacetylase/succinyl-diaminopimelate desuccinylase-like protein